MTKLLNTEQSSKGKGKTHNLVYYFKTKSVNSRKTGKTAMVQAFPKKWWVDVIVFISNVIMLLTSH
jgi:hypothetical protein